VPNRIPDLPGESTGSLEQADCQPITTCYNALATCGIASDGCGGTLNCGTCPSGEVCTNNNCYSATCKPSICGPNNCGCSGDGCGGIMCCGGCPIGSYCNSVVCAQVCNPATCPAVSIRTTEWQPCVNGVCNLGGGNVGVGFADTVQAVGGTGSPSQIPTYRWSVVAGSLPSGLTLDPGFGSTNTLLHGTPTTAGQSTFTIQVEDVAQKTGQQAFTVTIGSGNEDYVHITGATYNIRKQQLSVSAVDPNIDAALTVYLTSTGQKLGILSTFHTGTYSGSFFLHLLSPASITLKSSRGASDNAAVNFISGRY
jgi:hypothetical protein